MLGADEERGEGWCSRRFVDSLTPRFDIRHANARLSTHQEPQGTGNREQGTGNGEWQLGERECGNKERGEGQVEECGDEGATNI